MRIDRSTIIDRAKAAIKCLRAPDPALANTPNGVRQSLADVIEELASQLDRYAASDLANIEKADELQAALAERDRRIAELEQLPFASSQYNPTERESKAITEEAAAIERADDLDARLAALIMADHARLANLNLAAALASVKAAEAERDEANAAEEKPQ